MSQPTPDLPPIGKVFNGANIPAELKAMRRWAVWKAVWNEGREKYDKIPYSPQHYGLSTKKVSEWGDFETASKTLSLNPTRYSGLGLVLTGLKGVVGIDLDACRTNGQIATWARQIVDTMGSYTEVSPSGNGLRILVKGEFHTDWNNHDIGIEMYSGHTPRFLTITGDTKLARPMAPAQPVALQALFDGMRKSSISSANVIPLEMPELINELALHDVADMPIPEATRDLLLHGPGPDVHDRSGALHAAGVQLYSAGYDDATVLSILAASQPVMDIALAHRRQDPDRALAYLWVEHCQKAKPKATTPTDVMAEFDDLSNVPEVIEAKKTAAAHEERFALKTAEEFAKRQKSSWIVKGLVPNANLGVIYGASGSGKSFFVLDLMAAVARAVTAQQIKEALANGKEIKHSTWRGLKVSGAKVCWIAAEGQEDMRKRVQAYGLANGVPLPELPMAFIDVAPNFLEVADVKAVIKQMRVKGHFDIVVVDTLAQVMSGGNENSGEDMGKVLAYCREITRLTGAMVILIHHSGKDESRGARGWSGLRAACDFEFEVIRADEDRVVTVTKMKGGADGAEYGFRLKVQEVGVDDDGDTETTCVVEYTDSSRASVAASNGPGGNNQKLILNKAKGMIDLAGAGVTFNEIVSVVWPLYPRGDETKRDQRKTNVGRDLRVLISSGFLLQNDAGVVSLPLKAGA
jgi:archaellum biogenesis ATPase FlaH